jgi:biopolymer transport protein ExbD
MPRRESGGEAVLSPNLTPLLDVVLQLITFFMMLVHFGSQIEGAAAEIRLPVAPAALPSGDLALDRLVVALDAKGTLTAEGTEIDAGAADAWWADQARRRRVGADSGRVTGPGEELPTLVVVRADRSVSYGAVRRLLATAQEKGFAHFTLVVLKGAPG